MCTSTFSSGMDVAVESILSYPTVRVRDRSLVKRKLTDLLKGGNDQLAVSASCFLISAVIGIMVVHPY